MIWNLFFILSFSDTEVRDLGVTHYGGENGAATMTAAWGTISVLIGQSLARWLH